MDYMARALDLAERAKGLCNPNPAVGAVVVRDGRMVGEGFTQARGEAHAEVIALEEAGSEACGGTLVVTLEPCVHHGFTGPCTERIIAAGIREVRCSMLDPSAWVNGRGKAQLEDHGVRVIVGEGHNVARRLNQDYLHWVTSGRPFVTAKYAMSLDGKIATHTGSSRWISGEPARDLVGQMRSRTDAVLVGIGTVLADDPSLTARRRDGSLLARQPLRVVVDSQGRLPASARLLDRSLPGRTLVATTSAAEAKLKPLASDSVEIWTCEAGADGRVQVSQLLAELGRRAIISVLVESGGTLLASLFEQGLIDEIAAFISPKLIGGTRAPTPLGGQGVDEASASVRLLDVTYERVGADLLVRGFPRRCSRVS